MSIEFVMWLPVMLVFICLCANASILFFQQQLLYDGVRDATRQVSLGIKSASEAEQELSSRYTYEVTPKVSTSGEYVTASVTVPFKSILIFGAHLAGDATLNATVTMWIEDTSGGTLTPTI